MARPQGDRSATRDHIIDAAGELFAERGYAATSLREIADHLGLSKAALHHHFRSKDDLLDALIEPALARIDAVIAAAPQPPLDRRARRALFGDFLAAIVEAGDTMRVLGGDPSALLRPHVQKRTGDQLQQLEEILVGPTPERPARFRARAALAVLKTAAIPPQFSEHLGAWCSLKVWPELEGEAIEAALDVLGPVRR